MINSWIILRAYNENKNKQIWVGLINSIDVLVSTVFPSEVMGSSPKLLIPILPLQVVLRRVEVFG